MDEGYTQRLIKARGDMRRKEATGRRGISLAALSMYESGSRVPRDELKIKMAKLYGTTVGYLFFNEKVHIS